MKTTRKAWLLALVACLGTTLFTACGDDGGDEKKPAQQQSQQPTNK